MQKKIGIVTLYHESTNYGGNLQAYALCEFLKEQGYNAKQICFLTSSKSRESVFVKLKRLFFWGLKSALTKIKISDITVELPDLKNCDDSKSIVIGKWLSEWIKTDLSLGKVQVNNIIPSKSEFAYLLGVSVGTMQNAFRNLEDVGYVESKQCI